MNNKGSDENVANIEDDVRLIKRYLEDSSYKESDSDFFKNGGWEIIDLEIPRAMENILAEREQMLKEREKYTIRLTDEEYRKVIENAQMDTSNDRVIAIKFAIMQQQINEKDKRIQELEAKLEFKKFGDLDNVEFEEYMSQFIPTQVVIDKIKENKQILDKTNDGNLRERLYIENGIMKELLKGERK